MSQIRAISAGAKAETERFSGTVHSVFARACNIALDDGRLLALLSADMGNAPNAIRLDLPGGFAFDRALRTGDTVACRAGVMRFGGAGLSVRLASAQRWHFGLDQIGVDLRDPRIFAAWRTVRCCLRRHEAPNGMTRSGIPPGRALALWRAVRAADAQGADKAVRGLIGCGVGLTPAGDDLVVGFLAGLQVTRCGAFRAVLGAAVTTLTGRTNPISAAHLCHAAEGGFAEPLVQLTCAIARGAGPDEVARAARPALAVGATSGGDGVRGLLLGLAVSPSDASGWSAARG